MYHRVIRKTTLHFALLVVSAAAFAGGSHADGHGASAIGEPGQADRVGRTISVDMTDDMRFSTPVIAVQQGETIRFLARNSGRVKHEMVLGTPQELQEHYAMMLKMPGMEHADANMVGVAPGKEGAQGTCPPGLRISHSPQASQEALKLDVTRRYLMAGVTS